MSGPRAPTGYDTSLKAPRSSVEEPRYLDGQALPHLHRQPDFLIASRYADVIDTCPGSQRERRW